jgi:hypothetical protein
MKTLTGLLEAVENTNCALTLKSFDGCNELQVTPEQHEALQTYVGKPLKVTVVGRRLNYESYIPSYVVDEVYAVVRVV